MPKLESRTLWILAGILVAFMATLWLDGIASEIAQIVFVLGTLGLVLWAFARSLKWFLFRVGRRLAFSYFLIGVLPIPMVLLLGVLLVALFAGFYVGDLYRTGVVTVYQDIGRAADLRLAEFAARRSRPPSDDEHLYAYYKKGVRISGDPRLPRRWPEWIDPEAGTAEDGLPTFVALEDGTPTLFAARTKGDLATIALYTKPVDTRVSDESGVWTAMMRSDDPNKSAVVQLNILGNSIALRPIKSGAQIEEERNLFFANAESDRFWNRPILFWVELSGPLRALDSGEEIAQYVAAELNATPVSLYRRLIAGSTELSTAVIASFATLVTLLSAIYAIAVAMALFMIYALSRAVNSLTTATEAVRDGDFGARIPVHREDQLGELQNSFNQMTANLQQLVATAAEAEILEKELSIARDVQQSLIPSNLPSTEEVEFATLFAPSAAIGGDYFDVLPLADGRLAIVVADVSGHGLPTGLRMAMLKAALGVLVDEGHTPGEVFARLHDVVRADSGSRYFVTATICRIDLGTGQAEITNAGHPPTYVVRGGEAREIILPGTPLGTLGTDYGQHDIDLEAGDFVVWLSDGLIERVDPRSEAFGYDRLRETLSVEVETAAELRDRLVGAIEAHAGGVPAGDDCTLVVMRYSPPSGSAPSPSAAS